MKYTPTPNDAATGARIRQLRLLAGETLIETTQRSGVGFGYTTLCRIENGDRHISIPDATKLAAHWNTTVDRIMIKQAAPEQFEPVRSEQAWLGNEEPWAAPAGPTQAELDEFVADVHSLRKTPSNTLVIDLDNPPTPDEYRMTVWFPYLETRYNNDQKAS